MAADLEHSTREVQVPVIFTDPVNGTGAMLDKSAMSEALPKMREILRGEAESRGVPASEDYFNKAVGGMLQMMEQQYQAWLELEDGTTGFVQDFELPGGGLITMAKPEMLMHLNATHGMTEIRKGPDSSIGMRMG